MSGKKSGGRGMPGDSATRGRRQPRGDKRGGRRSKMRGKNTTIFPIFFKK